MTRYLASPHAHNTYLYGDDYIPTEARPDLDASMRGMTIEGDKVSLDAFSERYVWKTPP